MSYTTPQEADEIIDVLRDELRTAKVALAGAQHGVVKQLADADAEIDVALKRRARGVFEGERAYGASRCGPGPSASYVSEL